MNLPTNTDIAMARLRAKAIELVRRLGAWQNAGRVKILVYNSGPLRIASGRHSKNCPSLATPPNTNAPNSTANPICPRHLVQRKEGAECRMGG